MSQPKRFLPLDPAKRLPEDERPPLKGIVFDVDGTLCTYPFPPPPPDPILLLS